MMTQKKPKIYRKTHEHVLIVMPSNSIGSLVKNPFKQLPPDNFYEDLTDESIASIYNRISSYSEKGEKTLLLLDDCTASLKKSKFIMQTLKKIVYNRRHLKTNIIITAQSYGNIPLDIRKNIQNLILFKPAKKEFELLFEELMEGKKNMCLKIMHKTFDDDAKHNFLFLNITSQRMFKNWDEIITEEDE